jgi:PAS domain-containing protein
VREQGLLTLASPTLEYSIDLQLKPDPSGKRLFENRVLRRIFGPKRDEVAGGWRNLLTEELQDLYSSSSIIRMNKPWRLR